MDSQGSQGSYSAQPVRRSPRSDLALIRQLESGDTSTVDYVSHPLDKVSAGEDDTGEDEAATKKKTTSPTMARGKTLKKTVTPRKQTETKSNVRKRSTGNATPNAKPRSSAKKDGDQSIADVAGTSQDVIDHTQSNNGELQQLANLNALEGKVDAEVDRMDSDLSELGQTPEPPGNIDQPLENVKAGSEAEALIEQPRKEDLQSVEGIAVSVPTTGSMEGAHQELAAINLANHAPTSLASGSVMNAEQPPLVTPQADVTAPTNGALESPASPGPVRQSRRLKTQPTRFDGLVPTPTESDEQTMSAEQDSQPVSDGPVKQNSGITLKLKVTKSTSRKAPLSPEKLSSDDLANDVPATSKIPRKRKAPVSPDKLSSDDLANDAPTPSKVSRKRKAPVSSEKVSSDDLANDIPTASKISRKRKAETATTTPRKKTVKKETSATDATPATKPPRQTPAPSRRKKETAATATLKTETTQSQAEFLEASGLNIDQDLLKLSRALTYRKPLGSKPEPCGKPEVWAPGRQELCETVPYYKSAHSGCYSRDNNVYAFMFDSSGMSREYMDQDVIIARMGGGMDTDPKTGVMAQAKDHDIDAGQPRSLLNNIIHRNPLAIICGNKNSGAPTSMPHRYCVLDWFKPTHIWAEMTMGKKGPTPTIRYRFERLNTSKPSWYAPGSGNAPEVPSDLVLPSKTCDECLEACPQVYLIGWVCTNPKCVAMWKLSNGQNAPYGELDYHPAFLLHRTKWEREDPPFSLNPGVPEFGQHIGDNLTYINTRGIVCPKCGRCNPRYKFTHWQCDTAGCDWKLMPDHHLVTSSSLTHHPWDMTSDGPTLVKAQTAPIVNTQVKYRSNYKLLRYTIEGVAGSVIVAKANKKVVSEPGGPDDMFKEMQSTDLGLERRMLRASNDGEPNQPTQQHTISIESTSDTPGVVKEEQLPAADDNDKVDDEPEDDHHKAEVGARMTAFGMNYGMPYKFIASGDSRSFEEAPAAVRTARARLDFAQREFVNEPTGYQDFNEELVFGYLQGQIIKYHDDGEKGLGPRIATLSLGAGATMSLRVKAKYHSQVSNTGVFTFEKPLPLPVLESSTHGLKPKSKTDTKSYKEIHAARVAAFEELEQLKNAGKMAEFRKRSKEIPKELKLKRGAAQPLLSFHLAHGDIVLMEGEEIQKFLEHQVEPQGNLRFALTCRTILANHLTADQLPKYEVGEAEVYDGSGIREEGDAQPLVWD